jgi:ABC-type nitrate/sulfonate/bicarbonate transport system substrate-binding protein
MPVTDCAPLVYAQEAGLFEKYDVDVVLHRETTWSGVRDKVIQGTFDAAHAPATLPFMANLGLESDPCACVSALVLNLQGNGITLCRELCDAGVRDAAGLKDAICSAWGKRTYTFAVPSPYSTQYLLLRQWLLAANIAPEHEVRIVIVPVDQMFPTLKLGYIDGYCAGEPWTSLAEHAEVGLCVATSAELAPLHPEKILIVRQSFATGRSDEHERLIAALLEACAFCDDPDNRTFLGGVLAHPQYVNAPLDCLETGFTGPVSDAKGVRRSALDLNIFSRHHANEPSDEQAAWLIQRLYEVLDQSAFARQNLPRTPMLKNIFRKDIFERARLLVESEGRVEGRSAACEAAG